MLVVAIKTLYGGIPSRPACGGALSRRRLQQSLDYRGGRRHRSTNFNDVVWAMCTRCDPRIRSISFMAAGVRRSIQCATTPSPTAQFPRVIDACIPFRRKKTFPKNRPAPARRSTIVCGRNGKGLAEGILVPIPPEHGSLEANHEGSRTTGCPVYRALGPGLRSAWICHQVTRPSSSALYSLTRLRCGRNVGPRR